MDSADGPGSCWLDEGTDENFIFQLSPNIATYSVVTTHHQYNSANSWPSFGQDCLYIGNDDPRWGGAALGGNGFCQWVDRPHNNCLGAPINFCGAGRGEWGETELEVWYALKDWTGLPQWDSGELRSTGNPSNAAFTLYKLPAVSLNQGDTEIYTAACAEYGLQGIGCYAGNAWADAHYSDLTQFDPPGLPMPYEFGCQMNGGAREFEHDSRGDPHHDLGSSTGWTDLLYYNYQGNGLDGMLAHGVPTLSSSHTALSPVCALAVPPALTASGVSAAQYRAGLAAGVDRGADAICFGEYLTVPDDPEFLISAGQGHSSRWPNYDASLPDPERCDAVQSSQSTSVREYIEAGGIAQGPFGLGAEDGAAWYRLPPGSRLPTSPPGWAHCSTGTVGWLSGWPSSEGQIPPTDYSTSFAGSVPPPVGTPPAVGTVCFQAGSEACRRPTTVQAVSCGAFALWQLPPPEDCTLAYCLERMQCCSTWCPANRCTYSPRGTNLGDGCGGNRGSCEESAHAVLGYCNCLGQDCDARC